MRRRALFVCLLWLAPLSVASSAQVLFDAGSFTDQDAVLVVDQSGEVLYQWQAQQPLIPASLTKLVTTYLAIDKWGLDHRFHTDFYIHRDQLWVKGYGDPYLISEELDLLAAQLAEVIAEHELHSIHLDNRFFQVDRVPGRSTTADPYNAPLSAIAANFNTANLKKIMGRVVSAEAQTPITPTAVTLAANIGSIAERVNLQNQANAQRYFAEILASKLGRENLSIRIDGELPDEAILKYRHRNSRTLADSLRGALTFSNNFIANQLYLKLAESDELKPVNFAQANAYVKQRLGRQLGWHGADIEEGSGLSRGNRMTARQIDQVLAALTPHKHLLKPVKTQFADATVHAKTGTLEGVRSYAGYIDLPQGSYRFVYVFNRGVPFGFRDQMLHQLIKRLSGTT